MAANVTDIFLSYHVAVTSGAVDSSLVAMVADSVIRLVAAEL